MNFYEIGAITNCGHVRTVNQDRFLVCTGGDKNRKTVLLAVADGMGGLLHGEKASNIVMQMLCCWWRDYIRGEELPLEQVSRELDSVIYEAHRQIYYTAQKSQEQSGTTLSLLLLKNRAYIYKQIGDSRIYLSEDFKTRQLTIDQTWCNDRLMEGSMSYEEALIHPMRHALSNALGASDELQIVTGNGHIHRGASFLLCSDGFYNNIVRYIDQGKWRKRSPPQATLNEMMKKVLETDATDNATAILCRIPYLF